MNVDRVRKTIYLGRLDKKSVATLKFRIEQLIERQATGQPMGLDLADWTNAINERLRSKLVAVGLLEPRPEELVVMLADHLADVMETKRSTFKVGTQLNWQATVNAMMAHFGNVPITSLTPSACEQWRRTMLASGLREPSVHKHIQRARAAMELAKSQRKIENNPFQNVKQRVGVVNERQHYVPMETFWQVVEHAPNETWRVLLVLARIQGMRTPSEPFSLRWRDITWPDADGQDGSILITSPKGEHITTKAQRRMPLFAEVVPYLRALQSSGPASTYVIPNEYRSRADRESGWRGANLRTGLLRIIKRAGVTAWPKVWHNLRGSCETDLLRETKNLPLVTLWLGNSTQVAIKHYVNQGALELNRTGTNWFSGSAHSAQIPTQRTAVTRGNQSEVVQPEGGKDIVFPVFSVGYNSLPPQIVPPAGFEHDTKSSKNKGSVDSKRTHSDARSVRSEQTDTALPSLSVEQWDGIPDEIKRHISFLLDGIDAGTK